MGPSGTVRVRVRVRLWAAAREAVGSAEASVTGAESVESALLQLAAASPDPARTEAILRRCTWLRSGERLSPEARLADGDEVEVLPMFAGGAGTSGTAGGAGTSGTAGGAGTSGTAGGAGPHVVTEPDADLLREVQSFLLDVPLGEQVALWADPVSPFPGLTHVICRGDADRIVGYAQFDRQGYGRLGVAPSRRRDRLATAMWEAARQSGAKGVWTPEGSPAALAFAQRLGLKPARILWILAIDSQDALPVDPPPAGVEIRGFRPEDIDALVEVNAQAFAALPDQGSWTRSDFELRMGENFEPADLLVAVDGRELVGFHWTKLTSAGTEGEVFVIGVLPSVAGHGLGRTLLAAGVAHLVDRGARRVLLYVDSSNESALALYSRFGFKRVAAELLFAADSSHG